MATIGKKLGCDSGKSATQATTANDTALQALLASARHLMSHRRCIDPGYAVYEILKASLTACATTPAEYERACRQAADLAGV